MKRIPQMCLRISMAVLKDYPYSIYIAQGYHKCAPVITSVSEAPRFKHRLVSVDPDMSKAWSCETLQAGFQDVMAEALSDAEISMMNQVEDPECDVRFCKQKYTGQNHNRTYQLIAVRTCSVNLRLSI